MVEKRCLWFGVMKRSRASERKSERLVLSEREEKNLFEMSDIIWHNRRLAGGASGLQRERNQDEPGRVTMGTHGSSRCSV